MPSEKQKIAKLVTSLKALLGLRAITSIRQKHNKGVFPLAIKMPSGESFFIITFARIKDLFLTRRKILEQVKETPGVIKASSAAYQITIKCQTDSDLAKKLQPLKPVADIQLEKDLIAALETPVKPPDAAGWVRSTTPLPATNWQENLKALKQSRIISKMTNAGTVRGNSGHKLFYITFNPGHNLSISEVLKLLRANTGDIPVTIEQTANRQITVICPSKSELAKKLAAISAPAIGK